MAVPYTLLHCIGVVKVIVPGHLHNSLFSFGEKSEYSEKKVQKLFLMEI